MTLDANDYLTYHLYAASKSPRIKSGRRRSWIVVTGMFLLFSYLFHLEKVHDASIYFLVIAGICVVGFPFYIRWKYKNHYLTYVRDTYKNRVGIETTLGITDDVISTHDRTGDARIYTSEIEDITEINGYYFIRFKTGMAIIISKSKSKTPDIEQIKTALHSLIDNKKIKYTEELNWKWK